MLLGFQAEFKSLKTIARLPGEMSANRGEGNGRGELRALSILGISDRPVSEI
jgi:hypothetical protein